MEFTGERLIPDKEELIDLYYEHLARYLYAARFVRDKTVLDLGCGCGYGSFELAKSGATSVVGMDNSVEAIAYARTRYSHPSVNFIVADALSIPFSDKHFDVVVCLEVLEHLAKQDALISEIRRVLNEKGILIISTPNPNRPSQLEERKPNPFHIRELEISEFKTLLSRHFKNVQIINQARQSAIWFWQEETSSQESHRLDEPEAEYFLALCSDDELPENIVSASYHFSHFENIKSLLKHLKRQDTELSSRGQKIVELQADVAEKADWAQKLDREVKSLHRKAAHHEARAILYRRAYEDIKRNLGYRAYTRILPIAKFLLKALKKTPKIVIFTVKALLAAPFLALGIVLLFVLSILTVVYAIPVFVSWAVIGVISPSPRPKPKTLECFAKTDGVSIVIPTWNGKELLEESLPILLSALEKSRVPNEVIVIDDASDDGTETWLRQNYPHVKLYRFNERMGFARAMNAGFSAATHPLIYALNNDMLVKDGFLEPLIDEFVKRRNLFAAASYIKRYEKKERAESGWTWAKIEKGMLNIRHRLIEPDSTVAALYAGGGASLFRKDVFTELGGFDPVYQPFYVEDFDLSFKAWRHGYEVVVVPKSRVVHKHRGTIGKHYKECLLKKIFQTNILRFSWQNFTDFFNHHFFNLPSKLALGTFGLSGGVSPVAFFKAFLSIPKIITARRNLLASIRTDSETIELARYPNLYRERFSALPRAKGQLEVLVIAPYCPYPPTHGGALRMYNIIKHLSQRCVVDLAAMIEHQSEMSSREHLKRFCREVSFYSRKPNNNSSILLPKSVGEFASDDFEEIIAEMCARNDYNIVQVEYPFLAHFLPSSDRFKRIVTEIDIFFIAYKRAIAFQPSLAKKLQAHLEWLRMFQYEIQAMKDADYILAVSEHDRKILSRYVADEKVFVCPNGVDCDEFSFHADKPEDLDLLFVGNFRHPPNLEGLAWFYKNVWQKIMFEQPLTKLKIAGANPPDDVIALGQHENVEVLGFVEDLRPLYSKSIFIAPILRGGGTRLKILEAMASGAPVVSTTLGAEGLEVENGKNIVLADNPEEFAKKTVELLQSHDTARELSSNARRLVEEKYHWPKIVDGLFNFYEQVTGAGDE